jgi:hypothetical protein
LVLAPYTPGRRGIHPVLTEIAGTKNIGCFSEVIKTDIAVVNQFRIACALFGGDNDNAVTTAGTINSRRRTAFKHVDRFNIVLIDILPPGTPFTTYSGPKPALRDDTPRNCTLGEELGSAVDVLEMVNPATFPCKDIKGLLLATDFSSLAPTCVIALDTSLLSMVP